MEVTVRYESPVTRVLDLSGEGIICASLGTESSREGYESGGEWPSDE